MTKKQAIKPKLQGSYSTSAYSNFDKVMDAYRSTLGNLYTSNDPTLSTSGAVERLTTQGYYGDVIKALKMYEADATVKKLIDESEACANTKVTFSATDDDEKTKKVYETWAERINEDVPNVIPGINTVIGWILLSIQKTGMAIPDFEWQDVDIDGKTYTLPMKMTVHPSLAIKLKSSPLKFGYEEVWLGMSMSSEDTLKELATSDQNYKVKYIETTTNYKDKKMVSSTEVWQDKKTAKADTVCLYKPNAFALKYKWTPQDTTYYPIVPLKPLFPSIAMKHKLQEADMSLLQRVISRIIHVKVGDKDNPPKPDTYDKDKNLVKKGTLAQYAEMWQEGEGTQIFTTDYTVSITDMIPDLSLVLNHEKYVPVLVEILSAFGIMQDPGASRGSQSHAQLNLTKYEKYLEDLQKLVIGYLKWLVKKIDEKNPSIKRPSKISMVEPYIDTTVQKTLLDLFNIGAVDVYTLLDSYDLDSTQIKKRKETQLSDKTKDGESTWSPPTALVQISKDEKSKTGENNDKKTIDTKDNLTKDAKQDGRPTNESLKGTRLSSKGVAQ